MRQRWGRWAHTRLFQVAPATGETMPPPRVILCHLLQYLRSAWDTLEARFEI